MRKVTIKYRGLAIWLLSASLLTATGRATPAASARPLAPAPQTLPPDQGAVRLRQPAAVAARLNELHSQREFDYREAPPATDEASSAWSRFWQRIFRWLLSKFSWLGTGSYAGFWRWLLYGLLAAAVVYVVLKLLQVDLTAAFGRSPGRAALPYDAQSENIHELDFPARLQAAEEAGNFRLATRLGYLELLKQLTDRQLISWQPDKTNQTYLRELAGQRPALRPSFAELTRQFEYVWYGELPLSPTLYTEVRAGQLGLSRQLGATRAGVS
ncbi:DUF4129 domain-containing protein [Hymenobacter baengnokdamensis]|uniref:DUF4129 domain-containing protein n=1 Tax=Hymenobacter baengnokdamensis TaxID=2615203 RepID=UPI001247EB71|nr:DUF4129 domain-containing protein [Hymenobacter baengnokdamensis]